MTKPGIHLFWALHRAKKRRPAVSQPDGTAREVAVASTPADETLSDEHPDVLAYVRATTAHLEPSDG